MTDTRPRSPAVVVPALMLVLVLSSCLSLRPPAPPGPGDPNLRSRAECAAIDKSFGRLSATAAVAGGVALASGIGGALADDQPDAELAFGISALLAGITAGVSGFLSGRRARQYVAECTANAGGR